MDSLKFILEEKRKQLKQLLPLEGKLRAAAIQRNEYGGFRSVLDAGESRLSVVAELSVSQPGGGMEKLAEPARVAAMFEEGGASAISVITESSLYGGSMPLLAQISRQSGIPVLARDWFTHPLEICQAVISGADAINLIAAILPDGELQSLYRTATGFGLDVMVEVSSLEEMETALDIGADLICINNNPHALKGGTTVTQSLIDEAPADVIVLSSGCIETATTALDVLEAGANGIILREPLIRADIPQDIIADMLNVRLPDGEEAE